MTDNFVEEHRLTWLVSNPGELSFCCSCKLPEVIVTMPGEGVKPIADFSHVGVHTKEAGK